jgi:hypothetical protein
VPGPRIPPGVVNLRHLHPQVTARALGGNTCVVSASAPGSPYQGDLWINPANSNQLSQWTGSSWLPVSLNAGSLTGENFDIGSTGQFHYNSPPAFNTWSFESGLGGWTAVNASIVPSPAQSHVGGYSALLTYTSGASWSASSPQQAVQAGNQVYVSAWAYAPQSLGAVGLQLAWYNSGGTLLSTSSGTTASLAASTWTQFAYNAAPPAGAVSCQIIVQDAETSVTGYQLFIDDVYISGQLATAIAPASGSDLLGQGHPAGVAALGANGAMAILAADENNIPWVAFATGVTEEATHGRMQAQVNNAGTSTETPGLYMTSPTVTGQTGIPGVALFAASKDLSIPPGGVLGWTAGASEYLILTWNDSVITANVPLSPSAGLASPASTMTGGAVVTQVDNSFTPQSNPTSPSRICKVWAIPAGDPVTLTAYRLSVPVLSGTWEGIPLSFQIAAFGQAIASLTIGGALMSAGTAYCGDLTATLIISQTGSSGILTGSIKVNLGVASANQLPTGGANGAGGFVGVQVVEPVSGIGVTADSMTVQASFGSSNAGQSIEGFGSIFERIGGAA